MALTEMTKDLLLSAMGDPESTVNLIDNIEATGGVSQVTGSGNIASSGGATPNITFTGTLPIASGGTNNSALGPVLGGIVYSDASKLNILAAGTSGQVLQSNGGASPSWVDPSGGGTPGGANTQVQYNDSGAFAGSANFTWNNSTNALNVGSTSGMPGGLPGFNGAVTNIYAVNPPSNGEALGAAASGTGIGGASFVAGETGTGESFGIYSAGIVYNTGGSAVGIDAYAQANANAVSLTALRIDTSGTFGHTVTNNIGIDVLDRSGATNNIAIQTGAGLVSFGDQVSMNAGQIVKTRIVTASPDSIDATQDYFVGVNVASASIENLPAGVDGMAIIVKDVSGSASVNNITINANGGDTFDNMHGSTDTISADFGIRYYVFNGGVWYTIIAV